MRKYIAWLVSLTWCLTCLLTTDTAVAEPGSVEGALAAVRHVKADVHSRRSSVLGGLATPEEMAAHQMRCRPAPKPKNGFPREIDFGPVIRERAEKSSSQ